METIIYVYLKKDCVGVNAENSNSVRRFQEGAYYQRQDFDMGDYRLVRVGVSRELLRILQEKENIEGVSGNKEPERQGMGRLCPPWKRWEKKRRLRRAELLRQQRLLEEAKIRQEFVQELLEDRDHSYFATEEPVPFLEGWSFRGYLEEEWVLHMMKYASFNHFIILGEAECIPTLVLRYVRGMKSLRWFLTKRQFREAESLLVEDIYEEYGLAVEVRLLEEERDLRKLCLVCKLPTVVIDFCEEERVSAADVAEGSIWLDMTSSETKRHRLEERNTKIAYFSLKKEWKQPQKALNYLDTISKNGYNT